MFVHSNSETIDEAEWVIVGVPSEIGSMSIIKNYIGGPKAIREGSNRVFDSIFGDLENKKIFDYGDIELEEIKNLEEVFKEIKKNIEKIYCKDKKYIFLGGDHSITYPIVEFLRKYHDFCLIVFDSHPDCFPDPFVNHQSFIYHLIKNKIIDSKKIIILGLSNPSKAEKEIIKKYGIKCYSFFKIWENPSKVANEINKIIGKNKIYVSIDLDVFDMGCGHCLEPLGIRPFHFFKIIKGISNKRIVGFDIVELYSNEICENLSARILIEMVSIFK